MLIFPEVNGIHLNCANADIIDAGLGVVSDRMDNKALLAWIQKFNR